MLTKNHDKLTAEVQAHIAADAVIQGNYWDGLKGCFIGCLAHSSDAIILQDWYGLPLPLVRICEVIFEGLTQNEAKDFFAAIPNAVGRDGKDLSRVSWQFFAAELRALPPAPEDTQKVIDQVIAGVDLLAKGQDWPDDTRAAYAAYATRADYAAYAATRAAYAADAADAATRATYAADAAIGAARAAGATNAAIGAALKRQRDTILRLISEAN